MPLASHQRVGSRAVSGIRSFRLVDRLISPWPSSETQFDAIAPCRCLKGIGRGHRGSCRRDQVRFDGCSPRTISARPSYSGRATRYCIPSSPLTPLDTGTGHMPAINDTLRACVPSRWVAVFPRSAACFHVSLFLLRGVSTAELEYCVHQPLGLTGGQDGQQVPCIG